LVPKPQTFNQSKVLLQNESIFTQRGKIIIERRKRKSSQKEVQKNLYITIAIIWIIGITGGAIIIQNMAPSGNTILDVGFPIEPDTFHYQEFTVKTDGVLQIEMSCVHEDGNLLWYIMDCDASTFLNRGESEFYDLTYKWNILGETPISDKVEIESGTYTFVYVQTVGYIGEQTTTVKIVFRPS